MFYTTKVNKSGERVMLYLFAEIKGHNITAIIVFT